MATVSLAGRLNHFDQIKQNLSAVASIATSFCDTTDSSFRRVHVTKKDAQGNMRFFNVKDASGNVTRSPFLSYVEHIKTGDLQLDEPMDVVALKCVTIALSAPFYTFGKMWWYVFHTPMQITMLVLDTLVKAGNELSLGKLYEGSVEMGRGLAQIIDVTGNGIFEVIKAPLFGLGMELAAIYGIFKPYHGRRIEALIENAWQQGISYKEDMRNIPPRPDENCWQSFITDMNTAHPFYLAHCFQIRGNIQDPRFSLIRREHLTQQ